MKRQAQQNVEDTLGGTVRDSTGASLDSAYNTCAMPFSVSPEQQQPSEVTQVPETVSVVLTRPAPTFAAQIISIGPSCESWA